MKRFLLFITAYMLVVPVMAQERTDLANGTRILKDLQNAYTMYPLSFDVKYLYSNEHTPEKVLDSLKGKIEMNGTDYRCQLDSTETIHNSKYNIILFKEDKIMYLAGASVQVPAEGPLASMQTILEKSGVTSCMISSEKGKMIIRFDFAAGGVCKQMQIVADTVKQRLYSMQYVIKTALLKDGQDSTENTEMEGYEEYALVKTSFYNYRDLQPDSKRFDESTFFYKEGAAFKVMPTYEEYKIFIATPNL
jgi:hypothetical protein